MPLYGRIEHSFRQELDDLPLVSRRLLELAAADPVGDSALLWQAAARLGIDCDAAAPAVDAGLFEIGTRVRFRHPLVRSAVYRSAPPTRRREAHRALAAMTNPGVDPDRRAWHRAQGAAGPDEDIARELEHSADRARARGGLAAAAAFLERAAALTAESTRRAGRLLAAAKTKRDAGALEAALGLLTAVDASSLDPWQTAQAEYLRGEIALDQVRVRDGAPLLKSAAEQFEALNAASANVARLQAIDAAMWLGDADDIRDTAAAAPNTPATAQPQPVDVVLQALTVRYTQGYAAAAPLLADVTKMILAAKAEIDDDERWLPVVRSKTILPLAAEVWDAESWHATAVELTEFTRRSGAHLYLMFYLEYLAWTHLIRGEFGTAALTLDEGRLVAEALGEAPIEHVAVLLAAWRGNDHAASGMIDTLMTKASAAGIQKLADFALYARAVLHNGLGRHDAALVAARQVFSNDHVGFAAVVIPELAEAASRSGQRKHLQVALDYVSDRARTTPTPWALGTAARLRALLAPGKEADVDYRRSLEFFSQAQVGVELARGHLLYGEWLRRENRRMDARPVLRTAAEMFTAMGAEGFAARARRELLATGETLNRQASSAAAGLTAQELQVASLARDGLSNPEIGTRLFISARTAQYHLRKVFTKLDISSRAQLAYVLPPENISPPIAD
jgi:DNA-binding CsgD family transcriptional regulator